MNHRTCQNQHYYRIEILNCLMVYLVDRRFRYFLNPYELFLMAVKIPYTNQRGYFFLYPLQQVYFRGYCSSFQDYGNLLGPTLESDIFIVQDFYDFDQNCFRLGLIFQTFTFQVIKLMKCFYGINLDLTPSKNDFNK